MLTTQNLLIKQSLTVKLYKYIVSKILVLMAKHPFEANGGKVVQNIDHR